MADFRNFIPEHTLEVDGPANVVNARQILENRPLKLPFGFGIEDVMTLLHDLVYILAVMTLVFTFFVRVISVDGSSMEPTLQEQDQLVLLSNMWYKEPQRGDIVVARIPDFSQEPIVKRVIAVEGDVVEIDFEKGTVCVNGEILEEEYVTGPTTRHFGKRGMKFPVTIEPGCVFLLGDNRAASMDSRYEEIGQVDERYIMGKVVYLMLPGSDEETHARDFDRVGKIG